MNVQRFPDREDYNTIVVLLSILTMYRNQLCLYGDIPFETTVSFCGVGIYASIIAASHSTLGFRTIGER